MGNITIIGLAPMQYFVRTSKSTPVEGPYSSDDLVRMLKSGRISLDTWSSSDLGEGIHSLRKFKKCDWFPVSKIPEIAVFIPKDTDSPIQIRARSITIWSVLLDCLLAFVFCFQAYKTPKTYWSFLGLMLSYMAITNVILYVKKISRMQTST